ncbi:MAG TPA: alpha/beta hydrolase, partial [Puia sp.]
MIRLLMLVMIVCNSSILYAQSDSLVLPLWKNGAPGFENRKDEPEEAKDYWVKNINNPSITIFFPAANITNGTAVLICPGGGHRLLVFKAEGLDPAKYLNKLGITAIILKYRLARETNSPYSLDKQPREDAYRAMRLVRSHYKEWK